MASFFREWGRLLVAPFPWAYLISASDTQLTLIGSRFLFRDQMGLEPGEPNLLGQSGAAPWSMALQRMRFL